MSSIDVIIPAYNAAETISAAVRSASPLPGARVLVVDDGSNDQTASLAALEGAHVIRQSNAGASKARERGLLDSNADYVVFLDADDEVIASGVLASLDLLESNPETIVAAGRVIGIHPNGKIEVLPRHYEEVTTESLLRIGFGPWPPAAAVIRRSALDSTTELNMSVLHTKFAEDYELLIRLSLVGQIKMHEAPSARYRLFDGKSSSAAEQALRDKERIRRRYAILLAIPIESMSEREVLAAIYLRNVKILWAQGRKLSAVRQLLKGGFADPSAVLRKAKRAHAIGSRQ